MKQNITHHKSVKSFNDISCHLELKEDHQEAVHIDNSILVDDFGSHKTCKSKRKRTRYMSWKKGKGDGRNALKGDKHKHKRYKRSGKKKGKTKLNCYNYDKFGHFARVCIKPKEIHRNFFSRFE